MPNTQVSGGIGNWTSSRGEILGRDVPHHAARHDAAAVFERMKKEPAGRKADYSVLRADFFVISGLQNLKKFYVRAQLRGEEVRGFTVLYDQAMAGIMEPVVVAMSSAYAAFPGAARAPPPRRKVEYASGVAVGPGHIVTSREALDGCYVVTVAGIGGADRVAEDKASGLALLRVYAANLKPVALAGENAKGDVTLRRRRRPAGAGRRRRGQRREGARHRYARARSGARARLRRRGGARCAGKARRHRGAESCRSSPAPRRRRRERDAHAGRGDPQFPRCAERGAGVRAPRPASKPRRPRWCG